MGKLHSMTGSRRWADPFYRPGGPHGNVYYVCSAATGASDSAGYGGSPDAPVATIDYAVGLCTADNNDTIVVLPGHTETVTGAAGVAVDVAGVTILGVGVGQKRPKVLFTTAVGASFDVSAAGVRVENLYFECGIDDQTAMVNVTAADVTFSRCEFNISPSSSYDGEIGLLASAAGDRLTVEGCVFTQTGNTAVAAAISFGAADGTVIRNNIIQGYHGTAGSIINSAAAVNLTIDGNVIVNRSADGNNTAIVLHGSSVGMISNNRIAIIDSSGPAPITAAAAFVGGNTYVNAVGTAAGTAA